VNYHHSEPPHVATCGTSFLSLKMGEAIDLFLNSICRFGVNLLYTARQIWHTDSPGQVLNY